MALEPGSAQSFPLLPDESTSARDRGVMSTVSPGGEDGPTRRKAAAVMACRAGGPADGAEMAGAVCCRFVACLVGRRVPQDPRGLLLFVAGERFRLLYGVAVNPSASGLRFH